MNAAEKNELKEVQVRLCLKPGDALLSNEPINSPQAAVKVMGEMMCRLDREMLCVVNLDNQNRPINYNVVSIGGINSSLCEVGNIFKSAILCNAAKLLVMHNHPSGVMKISTEDKEITMKMIQAGEFMDIPVLDHVIVGNTSDQFCSILKNCPEIFNDDYKRMPGIAVREGRLKEQSNGKEISM